MHLCMLRLLQSLASALQRVAEENQSWAHLEDVSEDNSLMQHVFHMLRWLEESKNCRWLLILDNICDPSLFSVDDSPGSPRYIPGSSHGHFIITTRLDGLELSASLGRSELWNIGGLDIAASVQVLIHMTGRLDTAEGKTLDRRTMVSADKFVDPDANALAHRVGGSLLALYAAGAYLRQSLLSFSQYRYGHKEVSNSTVFELETTDNILEATWILSLNLAQEQNPLVAKLIRLWAHFGNRDLWYRLVHKCIFHDGSLLDSEVEFVAAMKLLCSHGLAEHFESPDGYSIHNCFHDWIIKKTIKEPVTDLQDYALSTINAAISMPELVPSFPNRRLLQRRIIPHADRFLEIPDYQDSNHLLYVSNILSQIGRLFQDQGMLLKAKSAFLRALRIREKVELTSSAGLRNRRHPRSFV